MARPVTGKIFTTLMKQKIKDGVEYVYERKYRYNPERRENDYIEGKLLYKIVNGVQMPTRPKKKPASQAPANKNQEQKQEDTVAATRKRTGATQILDAVGEKSGIDQALYDITNVGDAKKILSLARFLVCTDGHTLPYITEWQLTHALPYEDGITEDIYGDLFKRIGLDFELTQKYFKKRIDWCKCGLLIAYDSTTEGTYSQKLDNARYGYNKEGLKLPVIKFLVLYSINDGQPIAYARQSGNQSDMASIHNAIMQFKALGVDVSAIELVTDNAYYSHDNLSELIKESIAFITRVRIDNKWVREEIDKHLDELKQPSNYFTKAQNVSGIVIPVTREFARPCKRSDKRTGIKKGDMIPFKATVYLYLYFNEDIKTHEDRELRKEVASFQADINNGFCLDEFNPQAKAKAEKFLHINEGEGETSTATFNDDAIKEASKYHGIMALVGSKEQTPAEEYRKYRLRGKIEQSFQIKKDDCDGNRPRCQSDAVYNGRLFVQFVAMGYYDYLYGEINRIKREIDDVLTERSEEKVSADDLRTYRQLKTWLHDLSLERILAWFDVYETSCVSYKLKMRTWTSSTTKRDQLFLKLLGVNDREGMFKV